MEIFISLWNLNREILNGKQTLESGIKMASEHEFAGVEIMDRQIAVYDHEFLESLKTILKQNNCKLILDVSSDLTHLDNTRWISQLNYVKDMLAVGQKLEAKTIRILTGGQEFSFQKLFAITRKSGSDKNRSTQNTGLINRIMAGRFVADTSHFIRTKTRSRVKNKNDKIEKCILALKELVPIAEQIKIPLVIENHWGISSYPRDILKIVEAIDSPFLGTCPDFSNFPKDIDLYEGLQTLATKALHVHAKSRKFLKNGTEKYIDYEKCMNIFKEVNYKESMTIEYEGSDNVLTGFLQTRELIKKYYKEK